MMGLAANPDSAIVVPDPLPWHELLRLIREDTSASLWRSAAQRLAQEPSARTVHAHRKADIAILATHTTQFLAEALPVAALSCGIDLTVIQTRYGLIEPELLDPSSVLQDARPDYVVLSGTEEDLQLGAGSADNVVSAAVERWTGLWDLIRDRVGARVVQCMFPVPANDAHANGAAAVPDSDTSVVRRINSELVRLGTGRVLLIDCDRLAAEIGWRGWRDPRYWDAIRQPVSPTALPHLARVIAGVLSADLGLTRRCLVVDLDGTLWLGVLGEDGIDGVRVGQGPEGAAFERFQRYLSGLRRRGVVLAIASKNDASLVSRALDEVPGMVLRREDFAVVVADWRPKSDQLLDIARELNLGLDSIAFADDNPAERAQVASQLRDVDVITLPCEPADYVHALAGRPTLEAAPPTADDRARANSYTALQAAESLRVASGSMESFLDSLQMRASVRQLTAGDLDRAAQLVQKVNQFNLTARRYSRERLGQMLDHPDWRCFMLSLEDRFADHGNVGLLLMRLADTTAEIETLLLSCRVIGRTAERTLIATAAAEARAVGCAWLIGTYVPTERNALVAALYQDLGFARTGSNAPADGANTFAYPLETPGPADSPHIEVESAVRRPLRPPTAADRGSAPLEAI
jgi:FkbH-like protein